MKSRVIYEKIKVEIISSYQDYGSMKHLAWLV